MKYYFHHIGIACNNIQKTAEKYLILGYKMGKIIWDEEQKVNICFLTAGNLPTVELLEGRSESPIKKILEKNGVTPYHTCFETGDMDNAIDELIQQGFVKVNEPVSAIAIKNRRIVFLFSTDSGLIELVEKIA